MTSMVERVARALHEHWIRNFAGMKDLTPWEKLDPMDKVFGLGMAEAAIEAMGEPTAEMVLAAVNTHPRDMPLGACIPTARWRAMITAALAEKDG